MSILLSIATPYCATHVADMQVTGFAERKPVSNTQRKSIPNACNQVKCLVGWTGLATIEGHNTGDWLHTQLDALSREDPPLPTFIETLTDAATLQFALLPVTDKRCEFVLAGWFTSSPGQYACFAAVISNSETYPWQLSPSHSREFRYAFSVHRRPRHPYHLSVCGDEQTAKELPLYTRGLIGLLKRGVSADAIGGACRQMAAAVAARQTKKKALNAGYVKTVGDTQLTVQMLPDGSVRTFSSTGGVITHSFPADIICPELTTKDMEVERTVDPDGKIHLHLHGWIKAAPFSIGVMPPRSQNEAAPDALGSR